MPKQIYTTLFKLIMSLSKSEKRAFKLFVKRLNSPESKKFILLFDIISKQKSYDEAAILKRHKIFSKKQMPNLKAHLQSQILKSLLLGNSFRRGELTVISHINYAHILYNKCLYKEALMLIQKAKKIAIECDTKVLLLEIIELQKMILKQTTGAANETEVSEIIAQTNTISKSISNINAFSSLSLKLNSLYQKIGFIRNNADYEYVNKYFNNNIPSYTEIDLSFQEKMYLYFSYTGFYFFIQDFRNGHHYAMQWVKLFDDNQEMKYNKPEMYIRAINSLLVAQNKIGLYADFSITHKNLILLKRDSKFPTTENINLHLFKTIYLHEINRHFMIGEFTSGTRIVKKFENELEKFIPLLDRHTVIVFYYKIACLYFGSDNYKVALKWLNQIINDKETVLREDIHAFARILRLICFFEMEKEDLLEYDIKSTYRYLLRKKSFQIYYSHILSFLKNLNKYNGSRKLLLAAFVHLKNKLIKLEQSKYEKRAFLYFDIISWLESKEKAKPVEYIIKQKIKGFPKVNMLS